MFLSILNASSFTQHIYLKIVLQSLILHFKLKKGVFFQFVINYCFFQGLLQIPSHISIAQKL